MGSSLKSFSPSREARLHVRHDVLILIKKAFQHRNAHFSDSKDCRRERLKNLTLEGDPRTSTCTREIGEEIEWLISYSDDWGRVDERFERLTREIANPSAAGKRPGPDGAWNRCHTDWYFKLEPTVDALQSNRVAAGAPTRLRFMKRLEDPETLLSYLWSLQISDVERTGRNQRAEMNAVLSAMSQIIFKDEIRALLDDRRWGFRVTSRLEESYRDFLKQVQHPETGYWGPWYRLDDRLIMVQDLSFTFHQISYLSGAVDRWPQIVDTTLAISGDRYPMGWCADDKGGMSNHHNFDVATIFSHGWPHMRRDQKAAVSAAVVRLLRWCLLQSLVGNRFDGKSDLQSFYFGVRFLEITGYFNPAKRFWRSDARLSDLPPPYDVARRLWDGFIEVRDTSSETSETIEQTLRTALSLNPSPAPPDLDYEI